VQPLPALRNTGRVLGPGFALKRWMIEHTGGRALARELAQRVIAHNPALLGAYDFADPDYASLMRRWLAELPPEGASCDQEVTARAARRASAARDRAPTPSARSARSA